jgi:hypothetical protein
MLNSIESFGKAMRSSLTNQVARETTMVRLEQQFPEVTTLDRLCPLVPSMCESIERVAQRA